MSQRIDRVDELLRQEIGALLAKELADPRIGFATITDVETSPDLRHAKVWVSVIGGRSDRVETVRALQASMGFVRHELGKRLRIKRIPDLHIHLDDSAERGTRLLHLLSELESGVDPLEVTPFNESLPTPVKRLPHEGDLVEPDADAEATVAPAGSARTPGRPQGRGLGVDRARGGGPSRGGRGPSRGGGAGPSRGGGTGPSRGGGAGPSRGGGAPGGRRPKGGGA